MFKIKKNVPIKFQSKYPFDKMDVGDSFSAPLDETASNRLSGASFHYARKTNKKFSVRTDEKAGVVRCWRVK